MENAPFGEIRRGTLVRVTLKRPLYLVPAHGCFSLTENPEDFSDKYSEDMPQIKEITGYVSGAGKVPDNQNYDHYQINPFGRRTMQLTESEVYSTGLRMGDIVVYKKDIENIEVLWKSLN